MNTNQNQSLRSEVKLARLFFAGKAEKELHYESPETAEVREAANFASAVTGVRKEFLMGMLVVESDLGRNVGKCTYGEVEKGAYRSYRQGRLSQGAWLTFLKRKETIKRIAGDLGYRYRDLKVSCNPSRYSGTGGAMGVGQFMPDTWLEYHDRVGRIVGKDNPDPWNLTDGVMAMAVKLSDVPGVTRHNRYAEKNAAKIYLSGGTSWRYNWYANRIQYWARNYHRVM
ncbi:MAG: lytic murein transglycosylase [Candidatus Moranbacteria bacterium]|nr:lytic murein transglycosylase [Candidatus Moranbacteria bacterium]